MKNPTTNLLRFAISALFLFQLNPVKAQKVPLGNGSYTTQYPGADSAGRNGYPSGSPQLSKSAIGKPVPTNDWWSKLILNDHAGNLFNYPITMRTDNQGLIVSYIPWGVIGDSAPIEVGVTGLNASKANISDYSDWTVTMDWQNSTHNFQTTSGIGMPFLYFEKASQDEARIKVNGGNASISGELLLVEDASAGADFVFYAPTGSTWTKSGTVYTSSLDGKNYWSMAMLPQNTSNASAVAQEYKQYAYVFPTDTTVDWSYNPATGVVQTDFEVTTDIKEGSQTQILQGLLPHQWSNLSATSPTPNKATYTSVRGDLKMLAGNSFQVENTYKGILPTLPYLANYSDGFSPASMNSKISQIENDALATWTDSYNEGQVMNRLVQTARIADQVGNVEARDKMIATVKERLEDWLSYQSGEVAFLFYYNNDWSAMLGYPAGHGQDNNINDHHFHWGYFIHAAAFMEQFEPGWADQWGPMINYLVRDAASDNRNDDKFPFLRNFSPFAGHSWANGFASFPQGNDQESTSESMQFNSSLIHWGTITGNDDIRDLGVYLYTTEQTAIEEYWLDVYERNFKDGQQYSLVSRVWGNSYDNGTFWTADITASYGIEMYPMHAGSLYLGHNKPYVEKLWNEIESNTGILSAGDTNPNLWHDTFWKYLSFINPEKAIELYDAYPNRVMKFGVSDAQTYHWLHAMNAMGTIDATVTADYPVAAVFEKEGEKTYVAHNYNASPITVRFSDGAELQVPARQMATNKDVDVSGTLTSDFDQAYIAGSVNLTVSSLEGAVSKVVFYDGNTLLGEDNAAPFTWKATNLSLGNHGMYARVYAGADFNITNSVTIQVGAQVPYSGSPFVIPGTLEAGHYDVFEGGNGQGVSYIDLSPNNEGGFRPEESVDAEFGSSEGATLGWLSAGEWVEYTIEVQDAGVYSVSFRCASANSNGGGPFYFEIDGQRVSPNKSVARTNPTSDPDNWYVWVTKTLDNLELNKGSHVLRLVILNGEFNLGKMTFARTGDLSYAPPVADAGDNISVLLTEATATLDASASSDPEGQPLTYQWEQQYGPTSVTFDQTSATPVLSNLEEGVYNFQLTVSDGTYTATDAVKVLVSETGNAAPSVSITAPTNPTSYVAGTRINIAATAADLDGNVTLVEFFDGATKLGEDATDPYTFAWNNASLGTHVLTAKATDNLGVTSVSEAVNVNVDPLLLCTETGTQSLEGSFSEGYNATFETIGTSVKITFELLDNKSGVIAYLFRKSPFSEKQMTEVASKTFSETISGLSTGETISYACKFAFAGGLAVTRYIDYVVGQDCEDEDTDTDDDGVDDAFDSCPNTPSGASVNTNGCAESQLDSDNDGVNNVLDECPGTPAGRYVDAKGCLAQFELPSDNFDIQITNESCENKGNGVLEVVASENHSYTATLNSTSYNFTNNKLTVSDLSPGSFALCLQVAAGNYEQCFSFEVEEGASIAAKATTSAKAAFVEVLEGTAPFEVLVNGEKVLQTAFASFEVKIAHGDLLEVKTTEACEGIFSKAIDLYQDVAVSPNPTQGAFEIRVPRSEEVIRVELYSVVGQLLSSELQAAPNGKVFLTLENKPKGVYFAKVHLGRPISLKIIKQ